MNTTPTPWEMTVRLHEAMGAAVGLTPDDIRNVQGQIDVGERLVAFETLCTPNLRVGNQLRARSHS